MVEPCNKNIFELLKNVAYKNEKIKSEISQIKKSNNSPQKAYKG